MSQQIPLPPDADILGLPIFQEPAPTPVAPPASAPSVGATGVAHLFEAINPGQGEPEKLVAQRTPAQDTELDWGYVATFREQISKLLVDEVPAGATREQTEAVGRKLIVSTVQDHNNSLLRAGVSSWSDEYVQKMRVAVFDAIFGLGRIQPLIDTPGVENIMIFGADKVYLDFGSGRIEEAPPVADSDEELIEQIQFIAGREGERGRPWSSVAWELRMTLPGGERLQAVHPPIAPRPHIVIRRHPLVSISLADLISYKTLSAQAVAFLSAAVKARKSIVVAGQQGTGKTTLVRALAHEMDPFEHIVTIESERELHLDRSGLHHMVTPLESRPGQGEIVDGRRTGEVSLDELIVSSLRHNTQRIIVGEVRGPEVATMFQAMQAGAGSMSTIHANTPAETIERLAVLVGMSSMNADSTFAYRLVEQHIDFIVQLSNYTAGDHAGVRFVSEISEVVAGEGDRPLCNPIFKAGTGSDTAVVVGRPQEQMLQELEAVGFSKNTLLNSGRG